MTHSCFVFWFFQMHQMLQACHRSPTSIPPPWSYHGLRPSLITAVPSPATSLRWDKTLQHDGRRWIRPSLRPLTRSLASRREASTSLEWQLRIRQELGSLVSRQSKLLPNPLMVSTTLRMVVFVIACDRSLDEAWVSKRNWKGMMWHMSWLIN